MDALSRRIGLVSEIVPTGTSLARALELAEVICALPQPALRTDKEAAVRGFGLPLADGLRIEAACFNRSIRDPATVEGLRQFVQRGWAGSVNRLQGKLVEVER